MMLKENSISKKIILRIEKQESGYYGAFNKPMKYLRTGGCDTISELLRRFADTIEIDEEDYISDEEFLNDDYDPFNNGDYPEVATYTMDGVKRK